MMCWFWDKYKIQDYIQLTEFMFFFMLNSKVEHSNY